DGTKPASAGWGGRDDSILHYRGERGKRVPRGGGECRMKLTGIHHVSILVPDMQAAVAWYRDVLGLREVKRPSNFVTPVRWLELGGQQIHLIPSEAPDAVSPRHFAIEVDDCQAARAALAARGVEVQETVPIAGADRFFITDPAGNNLEI